MRCCSGSCVGCKRASQSFAFQNTPCTGYPQTTRLGLTLTSTYPMWNRSLLLPQILHLLRSIFASASRPFFNQFLGRDRVKRDDRPICICADNRPMPDVRCRCPRPLAGRKPRQTESPPVTCDRKRLTESVPRSLAPLFCEPTRRVPARRQEESLCGHPRIARPHRAIQVESVPWVTF